MGLGQVRNEGRRGEKRGGGDGGSGWERDRVHLHLDGVGILGDSSAKLWFGWRQIDLEVASQQIDGIDDLR